jgi:hypothetical protein
VSIFVHPSHKGGQKALTLSNSLLALAISRICPAMMSPLALVASAIKFLSIMSFMSQRNIACPAPLHEVKCVSAIDVLWNYSRWQASDRARAATPSATSWGYNSRRHWRCPSAELCLESLCGALSEVFATFYALTVNPVDRILCFKIIVDFIYCLLQGLLLMSPSSCDRKSLV